MVEFVCILPHETIKRKKSRQYEATLFKTLYIRQQRTVILERWEANEMSPMNDQLIFKTALLDIIHIHKHYN